MNSEQAARAAANLAVMEWVDADPGRGLVGCTPSMLAQIAVDAYRQADPTPVCEWHAAEHERVCMSEHAAEVSEW